MAFEDWDESAELRQVNQFLKGGIGLAMIAVGLIIALIVLWQVYSLFTQPQKLVVFQDLISGSFSFEIQGDKFNFTIPPELLTLFIPFSLLSIAVGIANTLIRSGTRILQGSLLRLERNLSRKLTSVEDTLEARLQKIEGQIDSLQRTSPPSK